MSNRSFLVLTIGIVVLSSIVIAGISSKWWFGSSNIVEKEERSMTVSGKRIQTEPDEVAKTPVKPLNEALGLEKNEMAEVGGIERPKADTLFPEPSKIDYGKNPFAWSGAPRKISVDSNPIVAKLSSDLEDPDLRPKASSMYASIEPFDLDKYKQDKEEYLNQIRPARVNQTAPHTETTQRIASQSPMLVQVIHGEIVNLRAVGIKGMPVTFHSNSVAYFQNSLKTITLEFDEDGIATAELKSGPGSSDLINVLAASPVMSGQLKYVVRVIQNQTQN